MPVTVNRRWIVVTASLAAIVAAVFVVWFGEDDESTTSTTTITTTTTSTAPTTTTAAGIALEQPAIWPAPDVAFDTPEAAAEDFVEQVLDVPPTLGAFQQGDARSGEIEVFAPGEGDAGVRIPRSRLLLRQLGPDDGWFVLAAVSDNASISSPEPGDEVGAQALRIDGRARGFEGTVVATAYRSGDASAPLDQAITQGGAFESPEPFTVVLDLSAAAPGDTVFAMVRGGTGLETDPGDFGAIPLTITG